jgi:hypothetical protein
VKKALNVAAGELLRYLFDRFAYRWEQWMTSLREKREERLREREEALQESMPEEPITPETPSDTPPATSTAEPATTSDPQVQASAQTLRRSVVAFDSGQRRYTSTPVKQVEDPSLNQPLLSSNQRAYSDDAKAFCR